MNIDRIATGIPNTQHRHGKGPSVWKRGANNFRPFIGKRHALKLFNKIERGIDIGKEKEEYVLKLIKKLRKQSEKESKHRSNG